LKFYPYNSKTIQNIILIQKIKKYFFYFNFTFYFYIVKGNFVNFLLISKQLTNKKIYTRFFAGIYDYTCCYSIQKEHYEKIHAPMKAFYTFNQIL